MGLAGAAAGEAQFQRARLLVGALMRAGVRRAVTSPGSRSTPLVLAALDAAAAGLNVASIIDERAAGFFALGQARATGMPTVLICTSGTAPAHYLPAMMEAREAGVPLIALTADRPIELMDCAAPQTTDQTKLFGSFVNHFAEVDLAGPVDPLSLRAIRRTAAQAVFRSRWPRPAAVHVNVRARKPLEPEAGVGDGSLAAAVDALLREPIEAAVPAAQPDPAALDRAAALCRQAERGLIVAGPLPLPPPAAREAAADAFGLAELARRTGFPLLAEATSQSRFTEGDSAADAARLGAAWMADGGEGLPLPDLILQVGAPPVAAGAQRLIEAAGAPQIVLSDGPWTDPDGLASVFLFGNVGRSTSELCRRIEHVEPGADAAGWREDVLGLRERLRAAVASPGPDGPGFHDGEAAAVAVTAAPADALLMLGNSLPVRLVETWAAHPGRRVWVASQRGLSGIDGLVAGFLGSLGAGGFPAGLLLAGDVSLLHDLDGLAIAPEYRAGPPAVVVVIDNQGGRIFDRLPIAKAGIFRGPAGRHWLTPHGVDFGGLARAFGVPYARVEDASSLGREIRAALGRRGVSLIVATVAPGALAAAEGSLRQAVAASSSR
ncbi:MAG: 2-succinyl-5-enolpyruvyl-6-hydroxy-3-cyclohexene-1-carboxylic-acid synthase [Holophagales bacterium]|nr:2-succinyl-5-enolpyruvyl-6-hydroxy-3-cyclohexene-1-carboxylic-acid synthase [Holophagales bacterium]MYD21524.1 2-succinyl-5-enolpyruvyl-6-hydroxy-3-cyclohexene-1-carboxylic-acid synthase [Holophagales bacterium]MYI31808.1 2-succinyl-5-enolpyruvyl-6-hydroxy-3-cyclohexene-1-carboxylic-acid synthase [Holophagales bacterium]